jgi:biopolymer transport protein ExbD
VIDKITAIKGENKDITITISGDTSSSYGSVIGLMALLKDAGFNKVGLKTEARKK